MVHGGHAYMPARYRAWIDEARYEIAARFKREPITGPLQIKVYLRGPKRPRGDLDNLVGALWDAFNGPVWADDSQVEGMSAYFAIGDDWQIEAWIYPIEPMSWPKPSRKRATHA